jgi:hypothetical protein
MYSLWVLPLPAAGACAATGILLLAEPTAALKALDAI